MQVQQWSKKEKIEQQNRKKLGKFDPLTQTIWNHLVRIFRG